MAVIEFTHKGDFKKTSDFLKECKKFGIDAVLAKYGQAGADALAAATPKDTGKTASSWTYEITKGNGYASIAWNNTNVNKGVNIAIILQYGHGTGTGGWVEGTDYINPALKPIFEQLADDAWEEITKH